MINEIKTVIKNYLNNAKLCELQVGTVTSDGIKVSDKLTLPMELIKGNLKDYISQGDKVRLIRNHGGQEFYIAEIIGRQGNVLEDKDNNKTYFYRLQTVDGKTQIVYEEVD